MAISAALAAALAAFIIGGMFENVLFWQNNILLFWLALAIIEIIQKRKNK
ncbi:MAG: hypothetical protein HY394_04565 [Candidatus Diapherotrites archaeon]|nr:hypothetical protein [Candidatus Diapherotrites archaeon]